MNEYYGIQTNINGTGWLYLGGKRRYKTMKSMFEALSALRKIEPTTRVRSSNDGWKTWTEYVRSYRPIHKHEIC